MLKQMSKINCNDLEVQLSINIRSVISLGSLDFLTVETSQSGTIVSCIKGMLWLTQPGDLQDPLLRAGQSFTLSQRGLTVMQGLPWGKALIRDPTK